MGHRRTARGAELAPGLASALTKKRAEERLIHRSRAEIPYPGYRR